MKWKAIAPNVLDVLTHFPEPDTDVRIAGPKILAKYFEFDEIELVSFETVQHHQAQIGGFGAFQAAADADKITIVNANFLVNFVNTEGYGGSHRSTSSVSLDPGLSIVPGSTVTIIGGYDGTFSKNIGSISLGQPVYSVEEFGSIEETTSTAESAAGIFSMVVGGLADISSTNSGTFAVTADPNAYQTVTSGLLKEANTQLVTAMAANR